MREPASAKAVLRRIDRRLKALGLSGNAASKEATGSRDTIRSIRRQVADGTQRGISTETIQKLAPVLKTSVEWLTREVGPESVDGEHIESSAILSGFGDGSSRYHAQRMVPLKGYVGAGSAAHYYAVAQGDLDEVKAPEWANEKTGALEIRGPSLGELFDRWLVFYDDVRSPVTRDLIGKLCIVWLPDDRVLVKEIRPGKDGLFNLISNNEPPMLNVAIVGAARVKEMRPRS